ncbi:transposase [Variovorax sp. WS11]|uniref:transposase n=1 Tax=Variovorax sp. WS11 TaxID=1105204 RepID=UPI0031B9EF6F
MVTALTQQTGRELSAKALAPWKWRGRAVKLVDGTGLSMPDTPGEPRRCIRSPARRHRRGLPAGAAGGGDLPGYWSSPGRGDWPVPAARAAENSALVRRLLEGFGAGDVMLADAVLQLLPDRRAAGQGRGRRVRAARSADHGLPPRPAVEHARSHRCWPRPARPEWMTHEQYARVPEDIMLREAKVGHQVLVTTLLEPREVSKSDLSALYARRWNVELDLRNLKTTTGMEVLSCQTPQMNEKQMWVHLLAYNVIRLLMAQAACKAGVDPRGLSFKHTVQLWTEWTTRGLCAAKDNQRLFALIAQSKVGHRPGRIEPRMRKRRPKPYPWLKTPREQARRHVQRHGHACRPK